MFFLTQNTIAPKILCHMWYLVLHTVFNISILLLCTLCLVLLLHMSHQHPCADCHGMLPLSLEKYSTRCCLTVFASWGPLLLLRPSFPKTLSCLDLQKPSLTEPSCSTGGVYCLSNNAWRKLRRTHIVCNLPSLWVPCVKYPCKTTDELHNRTIQETRGRQLNQMYYQ